MEGFLRREVTEGGAAVNGCRLGLAPQGEPIAPPLTVPLPSPLFCQPPCSLAPDRMELAGRSMEGRNYSMNRSCQEELRTERPESGDEPERESEDIIQEVQSILKLGRWVTRDEPFRGFGSLPGQF